MPDPTPTPLAPATTMIEGKPMKFKPIKQKKTPALPPHWSSWTTPVGLGLSVLLGILFIGYIGGCQAMRDTIANVIGAPTSKDIKIVADQLDQAEATSTDSQAAIVALQQSITKTDAAKVEADQRQAMIRATYAEAAARLPNLTGVAADALMDMMNSLQAQMKAAKTEFDRASSLVAEYQSKVAEHQAAIVASNQKIESLNAQLEGFDKKTADSIGKTVGLVKFAGETAGNFGVAGAGPASDMIGSVLGGLLTAAMGGTAVSQTMKARRNARESKTKDEHVEGLTSIIKATEKYGLIKDDAAAKEVKGLVRQELGPDVMAMLHTITAQVPTAQG